MLIIKIVHQSPLKQLELAFAYDDQLLIEDRIIANSADRETMELIGLPIDKNESNNLLLSESCYWRLSLILISIGISISFSVS